jgi:hypothetical protein
MIIFTHNQGISGQEERLTAELYSLLAEGEELETKI